MPRICCLVSGEDDLALLPALAMAGVRWFQVRDKSLDRDRLVALTFHVQALVPAARVIVNDRIDVAIITGADGVHLGASDLDLGAARGMVDRAIGRGFVMPHFEIGATCRSAADLAAAAAAGATYAGVGPVFATSSKEGLPDPLGVDGLAATLGGNGSRPSLPVLAIGGITAENAGDVMAAGADGVAVIGGIWNAPSPVEAARALVEAVR